MKDSGKFSRVWDSLYFTKKQINKQKKFSTKKNRQFLQSSDIRMFYSFWQWISVVAIWKDIPEEFALVLQPR